MVRQHDQLLSLVGPYILGHHPVLFQDADFTTLSVDCDRLARRCAVSSSGFHRTRSAHEGLTIAVAISSVSKWIIGSAQQRAFSLEIVHRPFSSCLVHPDFGHFVAPPRRKSDVVLKADNLVNASGQGVGLDVKYATSKSRLDSGSCLFRR